jgi:ATP-dependent Clp protease ATP-binding subunit ClpA
VDFRHTVVIMTSNLASRAILDKARAAQAAPEGASGLEDSPPVDADKVLDHAIERALASHFRPEFLNRIDEVIRFRPLELADLQRIVRLQLAELGGLLAEQHLVLEVDEAVVQSLVEQGYEPEYGARPLRRVVRRQIENPLATELLAEHFSGARGVRVELAEPLRFVPVL